MTSRNVTDTLGEHVESRSLDQLCGSPMELGSFLRLAIGIASALGEFHGANIAHKDLRPHNIFLDTKTGSVRLTDFSAVSRLPHERLSGGHGRKNEGALAYMSPEQTGRMNRLVDYRTDLYSLGVTLYEMLTGVLPFQANDPLEWVHCHIARMPRPAVEIVRGIPRVVSDIVMKLLAKTPEDRYQTTHGLRFDLTKCLTQWESRKDIESFPLGEWDVSDRLLIPQKLYGRERDIETLLAAFDRVSERGHPELIMVAGYAGIGKTSLVKELYKPTVREEGFFISGKADQYKRNIPYSTIAEALREVIQQILTRSDDHIAQWRRRLQGALGINGQLIIEVIPQVELIIGPQPAVPEMSPTDTQQRFNTVFRRFMGELTKAGQPLVVFLDDLQWVDSASLRLLEHLITHPDTRHMLLIGAYRDNEVESDHPLLQSLEAIGKSSARVTTINLAPLSFLDLTQLNRDTLRHGKDLVEPLTALVHEKTAGNPFFAIQFLTTLYGENLLKFDATERQWKWDVSHIRAKGYTDNVVDLMAGKLRRLSTATQITVRLAACIGARFRLDTLAAISDMSLEETHQALSQALEEGLITPLGEHWCAFLHDRIQQAAYSLIPEDQRAGVHLQIGRLMLESANLETADDQVFDLVNQLNYGADRVFDSAEKYRMAELNLVAGKKAKASTAYEAALGYFSIGARLFDKDVWETHYELAFDLYRELALVEYLNSNYEHSQELLDLLLAKAGSNIEKARLYNILIVQYTVTARYAEAIQKGKEALRLFDITLPDTNFHEELRAELTRNRGIMQEGTASFLTDGPQVDDPEVLMRQELLANLLVPARYTDSVLFDLITVMNVNFSIQYGSGPKSSVGYTAYGMFLGSKMNNFREGYEFGQLALRVSERFNDLAQKCQACFVLANYLNHWVRHLKWADSINNAGYAAGMASGEMQWTGYLVAYKLFQPFYRGVFIERLQKELPPLLLFALRTQNQWAIDTLLGLRLSLDELRTQGRTAALSGDSSIEETDIENEETFLATCQNHKSFGAVARYAILKAQIHYLFGRMDQALHSVSIAHDLSGFISGSISVAQANFYHSLILAALHADASGEEKTASLGRIKVNQEQMKVWVDSCQDNFKHQYLLVEAELARISGSELEAMRLYEEAIRSARDNEFVQDEAIACELASRFYQNRGFDRIAATYLKEARSNYVRWGADTKVEQLDTYYPWLKEDQPRVSSKGIGAQVGQLDAISVVKAMQAISGEIVLSNLVKTLMRIVLESAGAQKGYLILADGEGLAIEAQAQVQGQEIVVVHPRQSRLSAVLPLSIGNYVRRTGESVILDDASVENMFSSDPYIIEDKPLSVLCFPVLRQAQLIGLLYLENNLVKGAFTSERISVLELIASQAAISLENATLYQELRRAEEKYRGIFENIAEGIFQTSPEGIFVEANPALARMLGYDTPKELTESVSNIGTQLYANPDQYTELSRLLRDRGSVKSFELQALRKDGRKIWLSVSGRSVRSADASLLYYEGSVEDITARKRAEEERVLLATAIEQAAEGIIITDAKWIILYANPAMEQMSGYAGSELIGQHTRILRSEKHDRDFYRKIRHALAAGEVWSGRLTNKKKDGTFYEAEVTGSPVRDRSAKIINHVSIHRDITHEIRLERELRQAQKMEAIGTLAGGIAHDFNNILMAILGYAQLAQSKTIDPNPVRAHLEKVLEAGARAKVLVNQILTFSRQSEQERRPVKMAEIVKEALMLLRSSLPSTIEIQQEVKIAEDEGHVLADPTQMHQVLMNLCTNAAHAMRAKGGRLTIKLSETFLDCSFISRHPGINPGQYLQLTAEDTGHGVDPAVMDRIFDPYFTTKGPGEGTGLGLAVVQGIVKSHGGTVTVYSEWGKGTTFHVFLPIFEERLSPEPETTEELLIGTERVLFVDDEHVLVELGTEMLQSMGYTVETATNSLEALSVFRAKPEVFDLVITDMTMPGLTGLDLAEELMAIRPDIPVILCTGFSELLNGKLANEFGIRDFVMKPYTMRKLGKTIRKILGHNSDNIH